MYHISHASGVLVLTTLWQTACHKHSMDQGYWHLSNGSIICNIFMKVCFNSNISHANSACPQKPNCEKCLPSRTLSIGGVWPLSNVSKIHIILLKVYLNNNMSHTDNGCPPKLICLYGHSRGQAFFSTWLLEGSQRLAQSQLYFSSPSHQKSTKFPRPTAGERDPPWVCPRSKGPGMPALESLHSKEREVQQMLNKSIEQGLNLSRS